MTRQEAIELALTRHMNDEHKAIEARELETWQTQPTDACVYIIKRDDGYWAETWLGTKLSAGPIKHTTHHGFFSKNMCSIRFRATNGAEYYGRYHSDYAQFCRVRKAKG